LVKSVHKLITGLRTDPKKNPDLLGDHVDLLNRVETQALTFQNGDCWQTCRCVGTVVPGMVVVEGQLLVADVVVPSGVGAMSGHFSNQSTNQSKAGSETNPGPIHLLLISSGYSSFPRGSVTGAVVDQLLTRLWISYWCGCATVTGAVVDQFAAQYSKELPLGVRMV
jgi:hypothetical protein